MKRVRVPPYIWREYALRGLGEYVVETAVGGLDFRRLPDDLSGLD